MRHAHDQRRTAAPQLEYRRLGIIHRRAPT
jgi:hypothetical protein